MRRVYIHVEGRGEERFVHRVLAPSLLPQVSPSAIVNTTSSHHDRPARGGGLSWSRVRRQLDHLLRQHPHEVVVSTMYDLYRLPQDFPGWRSADACPEPHKRAGFIEVGMAADLNIGQRFVPYIQVHEFDALLLTEPAFISDLDPGITQEMLASFTSIVDSYSTPELVNDEHPPSHQIAKVIPSYGRLKATLVPALLERIGLPKLRARCPHFGEWISKLEGLAI